MSRTASRGGSNQLGDRNQLIGPEDNHYKKLVVNQEVVQKPVLEQSEKEKNQADYQQLMQSFAANNYIAPAVGNAKEAVRQKSKCCNKFYKLNIESANVEMVMRPSTPEE
jgi:hypothetical protein